MASNDFSLFAYDQADAERKEKSPNALRTISEASEMLDVPQHVLRFWETKFAQIKPLKRNGGRRFYRPQDLDVLQQIKHLLYSQGYTIKGAKKAIEEFAKARAEMPATATDWMQEIPPANVNDNLLAANEAAPASYQDTLAEIAEALNAPEAKEASRSDWRAEVARVRDELMVVRDELVQHLPSAA